MWTFSVYAVGTRAFETLLFVVGDILMEGQNWDKTTRLIKDAFGRSSPVWKVKRAHVGENSRETRLELRLWAELWRVHIAIFISMNVCGWTAPGWGQTSLFNSSSSFLLAPRTEDSDILEVIFLASQTNGWCHRGLSTWDTHTHKHTHKDGGQRRMMHGQFSMCNFPGSCVFGVLWNILVLQISQDWSCSTHFIKSASEVTCMDGGSRELSQ